MKEREFTFSATFSLPSPSSDLKVPNYNIPCCGRECKLDLLIVFSKKNLIYFKLAMFTTAVCVLHSTLSKADIFGTGTKCPSERCVRLIESQIKGVKKGQGPKLPGLSRIRPLV